MMLLNFKIYADDDVLLVLNENYIFCSLELSAILIMFLPFSNE